MQGRPQPIHPIPAVVADLEWPVPLRVIRLFVLCILWLTAENALAKALGHVEMASYEAGYYLLNAQGMIVIGGLLGLFAVVLIERPVARPLWTVAQGLMAAGACLTPVVLMLMSSSLLTQHTGPLRDEWLAAPELFLGVRQVDARTWAEEHGWLPALEFAYASFRWQARFMVIWWAVVRRETRVLWEVATAFALCACIAGPLYLVLPAAGPAVHYGWTGEMPGFLTAWTAMRSGEPYTITELDGYLSAPSFHAVFVVLLTRVWWNTPFRWASHILNGLMLVSTWVVGWHYLTDLIVGGGLACLALSLVHRLIESGSAPRGSSR